MCEKILLTSGRNAAFITLTLSSPVLTTHMGDNIKLSHLKGNVTTEGVRVCAERFYPGLDPGTLAVHSMEVTLDV